MFTISSFKRIENIHDVYKGKGWMKTFCESLREHAVKIIKFKKKYIYIYIYIYICKEFVKKSLKSNMLKIF